MLNTNMKVLLVANKYFSRYKHFCVALNSHESTSFDFVEKHSIVKPNYGPISAILPYFMIAQMT